MDFSTAVGFIATSFPLTCMFLFGKYGIVEKTFGDYSLQCVEFHLVENSRISLCVYKALIFRVTNDQQIPCLFISGTSVRHVDLLEIIVHVQMRSVSSCRESGGTPQNQRMEGETSLMIQFCSKVGSIKCETHKNLQLCGSHWKIHFIA